MARRDGQITSRGERKWLVRWFLGRDEGGTRKYGSKLIHGTKRDAQKFLTSVQRSRDLGTYVEPTRLLLGDYLDKWLETAARPKLAERTLASYRWLLSKYVRPVLGTTRLDQLRPLDVQGLIGGMEKEGYSPRTIRLAHAVLGSALKQAVRWGLLANNPAALVQLPKQRARAMRALSRQEVVRFRQAAAENRYRTLFDFMLATGARPSEARALRWDDLDVEAGTALIRGTKTTGSRRTVPLPRSIRTGLLEHRRAQAERALRLGARYARDLDLVFPNAAGLPVDERNLVQRHFKAIVQRAGLPGSLRLYDLRHTHATLLMAEGINPKVVAERLGHSTIRTTLDVYSHVQPGMQEEATDRIEATLFRGA